MVRKKSAYASRNALDLEQLYWRDIRAYTPINRREETHLTRRARQGDKGARNKLVSANLRFVMHIAQTYRGRGLSMAELVSEGNLGLLEAVQRFDERRGYKFITYAFWSIQQRMIEALTRHRWMVPCPANWLSDFQVIDRKTKVLSHKLGRTPTPREVADAMGITKQRILKAMEFQQRGIYLDNFEEKKRTGLVETVGGRTEEGFERNEAIEKIGACLSILNERERKIIRWYYGLGGLQPLKLEHIGQRLGFSKERIRQMRDRALDKLRRRRGNILAEFACT